MRGIWVLCLVLVLLLWSGAAAAGQLAERLTNFPNWDKPLVQAAKGDLFYPDWIAGTWNVTSTLVEGIAPLAPDVVTPGFESNRRYLDQPVTFQVRFIKDRLPMPSLKLVPQLAGVQVAVVADRAFNGLNLAWAYLGDRAVLSVKVDPDSPNRQITLLRGDRQLISIVTGRATETPEEGKFITTEVFQQLFRGGKQPYFNQVETTTAYRQMPTPKRAGEQGGRGAGGKELSLTPGLKPLSSPIPVIEADQFTAVYLSPQDPDYFAAGSRPVALYRYRLEFFPLAN